jgi:hypothetical protein
VSEARKRGGAERSGSASERGIKPKVIREGVSMFHEREKEWKF